MSSPLLILPVLLLVLLALVRPSRSAAAAGDRIPFRWRSDLAIVALAFVLVFGGFLGLRAALSDDVFWPNSEIARRSRWLQRHLLQTEDWENRPIIMLAGSSDTHFSIDPVLVESELERLGTPATILSFNAPGAIHFERLTMLRHFLKGLSPEDRRRFADADVLFLNEIFDAYDIQPLYRLEKEAATERAIIFLTPRTALQAWLAHCKYREQNPEVPSWSYARILVEHALLNRFAVGSLSERPFPVKRLRRTPPFFALEGKKTSFDFEESLRHYQTAPEDPFPSVFPPPQFLPVFGEHTRLLSPFVDHFGFFALPTIEPPRATYQRQFVESRPYNTLVVGPANPEAMQSLLKPEYWFDGVHSTKAGAEAVSLWFANELSQLLSTPP